MSDPVLREAFAVILREFQVTLDFLKFIKIEFNEDVRERVKNRIDGLEIATRRIEEILGR